MRRRIGMVIIALGIGLASAVSGFGSENPTEENAYLQAVQLFNRHDWAGARQALTDFQRSYPRSAWRLAVQLRLADLETDPARAEKLYAQVMAEGGGTDWGLDARWSLASTLFTLGKFTSACEHFSAIGESGDPRRARALYLAGRCQMALGNPKPAADLFARVRDSYPDSVAAAPALAGQGDAALALRDPKAALAAYDRYLQDYPQGDLAARVAEQRAKLSPSAPAAAPAAPAPSTPESPAPAVSAPEAGEPAAEEGFTIQVGAFTKPEYAQLLIKKLRKTGYNAYLLDAQNGAELYHQVRVGNYSRRQFAESIAAKLEKKERLPTLILPYVNPGAAPNPSAQ